MPTPCHVRLGAAILAFAARPALAEPPVGPAQATVSAYFTPDPASCAEMIAGIIDGSRHEIRVQAYWLTSVPILRALAAAERRGVDVAAILDKSQDRQGDPRGRYSPAVYLTHAGIRVLIDDEPAIAHSKVVVIDGRTVITGSFNFTLSADNRNAENVSVLESADVVGWFLANWRGREAVSRAFQAE
ncbi:MAG: phospholipase D family protein [Acetobacteraceae bacterium]|nr:phospholipase D family protein [Acetobacteraceae bacterium]